MGYVYFMVFRLISSRFSIWCFYLFHFRGLFFFFFFFFFFLFFLSFSFFEWSVFVIFAEVFDSFFISLHLPLSSGFIHTCSFYSLSLDSSIKHFFFSPLSFLNGWISHHKPQWNIRKLWCGILHFFLLFSACFFPVLHWVELSAIRK